MQEPLGRSFSLVKVSDPHIRILALKKAETSDETIVRLVEMHGKPAANVQVKFAGPIAEAREVNGQEQPVGPATVTDGALETSFKPYQPRTFALRLGAAPVQLKAVESRPVTLNYDLAAASNDDTKSLGGFDKKGQCAAGRDASLRVACEWSRLHAWSGCNRQARCALWPRASRSIFPRATSIGSMCLRRPPMAIRRQCSAPVRHQEKLTIEDWGGFIGQWDTRIWKPRPDTVTEGGGRYDSEPAHQVPLRKDWAVSANHATWDLDNTGSPDWSPSYPEDYLGLRPGYIKPATLAWYASHHHTPDGLNEPYQYSYVFVYGIDLPAHAKTLTLPSNDNIRILAVSVAKEEPQVSAVQPLYDTLGRTEPGTMEAAAGEQAASKR